MKTQLVCTFVRKHEIDSAAKEIEKSFVVLNNKIFLLKLNDIQNELVLSYNLQMDGKHDFLPNSIMVHRKKESNTIYTINALNELIIRINNGVLDKRYPIEWEKYRNSMLLKRQEGLKIVGIEIVRTYNI